MRPTALLTLAFALILPASAGAQEIVLNAVGDVSLPDGRFNPIIDKRGASLFDAVRGVLAEGDLNFVNVETAITDLKPSAQKKYAFSMPPSRLDWITGAGFNLISLANNHIADAGIEGIRESIAAVEARSTPDRPLIWSGVSVDGADRYAPTLFEEKGIKFALFAVGFENSSSFHEKGSAVHHVQDPAYNAAIARVRDKVDVVLVSAHYGQEYQHVPGPHALKIYRGYVDAGADVIIGHHPHVLRGIERYKNGLIIHSLGNFSFASRTVRHRKTGARLFSMIAQIRFDGAKVKEVRIHPLYVNNLEPWIIGDQRIPKASFDPVPVRGVFAKGVIDAVQKWSDAIPGNRLQIALEGDVGVVRW